MLDFRIRERKDLNFCSTSITHTIFKSLTNRSTYTFKNAIFIVKHLKVHMTNSHTAEVHKQFSFGPKSESLQTAVGTLKPLTFGIMNTYVVHFRV